MFDSKSIITRSVTQWINDLNSPIIEVRWQARTSLIEAGPQAIEPLMAAMQSQTEHRRWHAASVLAVIGDERCFALMRSELTSTNPLVGQAAVEYLGKYGERHVDVLLEVLTRCHPMVQITLVMVLEHIADKRAVAPLMKLLGTAESATLRYTIIHALGVLGDTQAVPLIQSFQDDADHHVRRRVQTALERLGAALPADPSVGRNHLSESGAPSV